MKKDIGPTSDGILRSDLPRLKPVSTVQEMEGLPEVVDCDGLLSGGNVYVFQ